MPTSAIPGFVTKKEASRRFNRSRRQLTRDVGIAMRATNAEVLKHFKLCTEDGVIRDGIAVTPETISTLRIEGHNPVWYVRSSWMEKTYGTRGQPLDDDERQPEPEPGSGGVSDQEGTGTPVAAMLKGRIQDLEDDKRELRDELRIKNQQISDANEREKAMNVLMRDLHTLMLDMQQRLLPARQAADHAKPARQVVEAIEPPSTTQATQPRPSPVAAASSLEQGSVRRQPTTARSRKTSPAKKRTPQPRTPTRPPEGPLAKSLPTLTRLARHIFRR